MKTHGLKLDGSTICGARLSKPWAWDCLTPTCGRCRRIYAGIKARVRSDWLAIREQSQDFNASRKVED